MNELDLFIKLLDDDMINFNGILMKYYRKLGINEKDIIVLSSLSRQETRGNRLFNPKKLEQKVALSNEDLYKSLSSLCERGLIEIKVEYNLKSEKEVEVFYLNKLYQEIINVYTGIVKKENEKKYLSFYETIANFYEENFNKQIGPIEAEIINRWGEEKNFSVDEIKSEMLNALKLGKASINYVDQTLIKKKIAREQSPKY